MPLLSVLPTGEKRGTKLSWAAKFRVSRAV